MRQQPLLWALAITVGMGLPAVAADAPKGGCSGHACAGDATCSTPGKCGPNHEKCGPDCPKAGKRTVVEEKVIVHRHGDGKDCCEAKGGKDHCDAPGAAGKDACCPHGKADCDDKECREKGGKEACGDDCKDDCEHHAGGHHGGGQRMMMHHHQRMMGHGHHGGRAFGVRQLFNQPTGRGYTMVAWDRVYGPATGNMWWNPQLGYGGAYGLDLADQTNTRHLGYAGLIGQNTFRFGAFKVTAGVLVGGGLNLDVTPTLGFQNYNGFVAADPRLSLGWQATPRLAVNLTGNYLFTTRPAAIGGPGVGLSLNYGF